MTATLVVLAGCGGDDLAEGFVENRIEAESGENVDIDLDDDKLRIQTDEGVVEMNTDGEGNVSIEGEGADGDFSMNADGEGNVSIEGQGPDGDFSIDAEDDVAVFEGDDGTATFSQSADIPDSFPGSVPLPGGLVPEFTQTMTSDEGDLWLVSGTVATAPGDVAPGYFDALTSAGFERLSLTETSNGFVFIFDDGEYAVSGAISDDGDGSSDVNVNVGPSTA